MNHDMLKKVLIQYDQKRERAEREYYNKKLQLYARIPELKEIDKEISLTGVLISKALINDPNSYEEKLAEIHEKMNKLKSKRAILLTDNNVAHDFSEIKYDCVACNDTGYLSSGKRCNCLQQALTNYTFEMSNINALLEKENFNTFDVNIFSTDKYKDEKLTPRQNIMEIISIVEEFIRDFPNQNGDNLLFYGSTGLGKTFMCNCIAKDLLDRRQIVLYQTAFKMLDIIRNYKFTNSYDEKNTLQYNLIFEADLLIIDDLGTEVPNSFTVGELYNIINSRLIANKKTIISTNLSPSELSDIYTTRVFSRILKHYRKLNFYGSDLRRQ